MKIAEKVGKAQKKSRKRQKKQGKKRKISAEGPKRIAKVCNKWESGYKWENMQTSRMRTKSELKKCNQVKGAHMKKKHVRQAHALHMQMINANETRQVEKASEKGRWKKCK